MKYIFLSRKRYENKEIPPEVIAHEATHVRQKHSLDILFIEFLQVIFWFNPLFWITKKSITLNHEFLADQGAVPEQHDIYQYQNILLSYASSTHHTTLESPFNYSSTKKRILMLSQSFNRKRLAISALLLIPIIAGCVLVFNQGIIAQPVDKAHEENTDPTLYARSIEINILDDTHFEVDGIKTSKKNLQKTLESLHTDLTKEQRDRVINIHVSSKENISYQDLVLIQGIATKYGYHRIVTPKEEIVRSKGNVPAADHNSSVVKEAFEAMHQQTSNNYATEFVEGAERNGEKALVIEIRNNTVRVNGKASSVATLRSDIDAITRDWSQEAYREAFPSVLVKNPDKGFIKKLNEEFLKTNFSKANGGMDLLPPPPPPPAPPAPSQVPPPPPPPSVEDHLKSMNEIGGIFYYENKEVTFDKALNLVKTNKNLNVQTRSPYTNAPKTYISIEPIVVPTQKENTDPVTKKDIAVYNKLAKKYNKNPNGQILKKEVAFMYDIYNRMTEKQKKNAESYPAIPPPPPPAPKSPKAPKKVGGNQLASAQKILGIQTIQEQTKVHLDKGGVFILNGKTASKKEVLDFYTSETTETSRVRVDKKVKPAVMYVDNIPKEMAYTPITEKEIKEYNTLAKKYRNNPNGEIKKKELRTLYHVYVNMSEKQKADAEPYPAIAPPPAQNKKIGALLDAPKNIKTRKEQVVKHAQQGGTFVLNTETSTVEEVLNYIRVAKGTKLRVDKNSNPSILYIDSTPPAGSYAAITEEEVQKYNALAKKYTDNPNQKVKTKDRRRLYHVYVHMTRSQRMVAEPYPVLPPDKTSKNGLVGVRGLSLEDRNSFNTSILDPSQKRFRKMLVTITIIDIFLLPRQKNSSQIRLISNREQSLLKHLDSLLYSYILQISLSQLLDLQLQISLRTLRYPIDINHSFITEAKKSPMRKH